MLAELTPIKPHCESCRPYGYRFESIDLYKPATFTEALEVFADLDEDYNTHHIGLGNNFPHVDRAIWEVARHIEGNFGMPYPAILVYSEEHCGTLFIFTPKKYDTNSSWWNDSIRQMFSNYLMGLRSLLDLMRTQ